MLLRSSPVIDVPNIPRPSIHSRFISWHTLEKRHLLVTSVKSPFHWSSTYKFTKEDILGKKLFPVNHVTNLLQQPQVFTITNGRKLTVLRRVNVNKMPWTARNQLQYILRTIFCASFHLTVLKLMMMLSLNLKSILPTSDEKLSRVGCDFGGVWVNFPSFKLRSTVVHFKKILLLSIFQKMLPNFPPFCCLPFPVWFS